ncbi:hypothetical protein J2X76_002196 [Neorhizobium sp. 2083]|uniref:DUF3768 domain-containing protein n=1 Tax=Neorhizobium sp. 2083 TaxID=2817762 RepID=UPI0028623E1F|nr:DUF3768 domain-containing protein [Neorhizobium sp. 2083]MDR6817023.1 hypothetical protein [Neorhizobium sp. 2083]
MGTITILPMIDVGHLGIPSPMTSESHSGRSRVRELNDVLRQTFTTGRVMLTKAVQELPEHDRTQVLRAVQEFSTFTPANDPHGEHDFGRVTVAGEAYVWKLDYYDTDLQHLSPDPADASVTSRVMTIMREDEY